MDEYESLSHTKWECKYHVIFIPKYRRKALYGQLRRHLGEVFRKLAAQKESRIEEGHLMPDHVHMMVAIPPKYAVSQVVVGRDEQVIREYIRHQEEEEEEQAARAAAALAIGRPPSGGSKRAGRVSGPREAALSGSH